MNGKVFAVGGVGSSGRQLDSIEVYQPSSNAWSSFVKLPSGRSGVGCAASKNNLIVAGGEAKQPLLLFNKLPIDSILKPANIPAMCMHDRYPD